MSTNLTSIWQGQFTLDPASPIEFVESIDDMLEWCFGKLGSPVINIEVTERQAIERILEATTWFTQNHIDGFEEIWYRAVFTAQDEQNQTIRVPQDIIAITKIYDPARDARSGSAEEFNRLNFLIANSDVFYFSLTGAPRQRDLKNYEITMQYVRMLELMFKPYYHYQFSRATGELTVPGYRIKENRFVMLKALRRVDRESSMLFNDPWLKEYCYLLIKKQWGSNLKKYRGVQLVGGVEVNGQDLFDEANRELEEHIRDFQLKFTPPMGIYWG